MKSYRNFLIVASLAFLAFSVVYGAKASELSKDWSSVFYSYSQSPDREERDRIEYARIAAEKDRVHAIVKPVSIAYYLLCLGFFGAVARHSHRRKLAILGVVACAFMTLWSILVGPRISFDEVYPAWIVAAIVLVVLQLVVSSPAPAEVKESA